MGISSRDYYRGSSGSSPTDFREWEIWKKLIALNAIVFLFQVFLTRPADKQDLEGRDSYGIRQDLERNRDDSRSREPGERESVRQGDVADGDTREGGREQFDLTYGVPRKSIVDDWFALDAHKVANGQIWRLLTAGFCHDRNSIWHLLINMVFLWVFGRRLEDRYGREEFGLFYVASLIFSSLVFVGMALYAGSHTPAMGASGAIWGIVALYALLYPYESVYVYFFPVQIRILAGIYFLADLHPLLLTLSGEPRFDEGVAHAAHVGGAIFGFLYWYRNLELLPLLGREPRRRIFRPSRRWKSDAEPRIIKMQPRVRTFASEDETAIEQQMDRVLERISQEGEDSLSQEDREILEKAKEIIRKKRASL